mmetsp:Transcript_34157/g.76537  ORF Transcript_34157/g.76537 Transcript_34157/m.76537 type:complete len:135 (-) Transcript_34157:2-406(-)
MLGREFYFPATIKLLEVLAMPGQHVQTNRPFLVPLPAHFVGRTFQHLLDEWCSVSLPLGLYRCIFEGEPSLAGLGYVFTCPPAETKLRSGDQVYVLAPRSWAQDKLGLPDSPVWRTELAAALGEPQIQVAVTHS